MSKEYNPLVKKHLENLEEEWGDPEVNKENVVSYGIKPFDAILYGINLDGELIVIQGEEKNRKTTVTLNVIKHISQTRPEINVVIDTLESSMNYARYRDSLISMLMTEHLMENTDHSNNICPICKGSCDLIGQLSPEAFKYKRDMFPTLDFNKGLQYAIDILSKTNFRIYDGRLERGNTRNLKESLGRWRRLRDDNKMDLLVVDHVQQYQIDNVAYSEAYAKLETAVGEIGNFIGQYGVPVIMLTQVSLTSRRKAKSASDYMATGGAKANQEANVVFTSDRKARGKVDLILSYSRISGGGKVELDLEPSSGLITKISKLKTAE